MGGTKVRANETPIKVSVLPADSVKASRKEEGEGEKVNAKESSNNKFEQLLKQNNELMNDMKQKGNNGGQTGNLVEKAGSPKSEYDRSKTTSNERSFASEACG